jgi:regulator of RNase E activity RraA
MNNRRIPHLVALTRRSGQDRCTLWHHSRCERERHDESAIPLGGRLRPMHNGAAMAGPALTVRTRPGDNLVVLPDRSCRFALPSTLA